MTGPRSKRFKRICGHCGGEFLTASDRARWCSPKCKQAAYRLRREKQSLVTTIAR